MSMAKKMETPLHTIALQGGTYSRGSFFRAVSAAFTKNGQQPGHAPPAKYDGNGRDGDGESESVPDFARFARTYS